MSVIYKKNEWIHSAIIDYGTRPRFIHDFVILLGQNIDRGHVTIRDRNLYFGQKNGINLITGENIGLLP